MSKSRNKKTLEPQYRNLVHASAIRTMSGAGSHQNLKDKKRDRNSKVSKREKLSWREYL